MNLFDCEEIERLNLTRYLALLVCPADQVERGLGDQDWVGGSLHDSEKLRVGDIVLDCGGEILIFPHNPLLQPP